MKSGTCGEYVVDQKQVFHAGEGRNVVDDLLSDAEGAMDVCGLAFDGEFGLGTGSTAALEDVCA